MTEEIKSENIVEQATKLKEELKLLIAENKEILVRQEELRAKELLSGRADAGQTPVEVKPEEKLKAELKQFYKGSAIESFLV